MMKVNCFPCEGEEFTNIKLLAVSLKNLNWKNLEYLGKDNQSFTK